MTRDETEKKEDSVCIILEYRENKLFKNAHHVGRMKGMDCIEQIFNVNNLSGTTSTQINGFCP